MELHMKNAGERSLAEHTEELLYRARTVLIAVLCSSMIVSLIPAKMNPEYVPLVSFVLRKIEDDLLPEGVTLIALTWTGVLYVYFLFALLLGFIAASPVVAYQAYKFVTPALYPHEKKNAFWFIGSFVILLVFGMAFSYWLLLPLTFRFLMMFTHAVGANPVFSVYDFLSFTILVMFAIGLMFTFPVFTTLLIKLGVITPNTLTSRWREIVLGLCILTAVITPDVSGVTMVLLLLPLLTLYGVAVVVGKITYKKISRFKSAQQ